MKILIKMRIIRDNDENDGGDKTDKDRNFHDDDDGANSNDYDDGNFQNSMIILECPIRFC